MSKTYELKLVWSSDHQSYIVFRAHLDEMTLGQYVEIEDDVNLHSVENEHTNPDDTKPLAISVYRSTRQELLDLETKLKEKFPIILTTKLLEMEEESWKTGWKDHFEVIYSSKFAICMPWQISEKSEKIRIEIEPGMAFGTGQHQTTRLCLQAIENQFEDREPSVLDVGTGSGILAIAAAKLGATDLFATDIDIDAVKAAETNSEINQVFISYSHTPKPDFSRQFDLVIANILKPALLLLAEPIKEHCKKGSTLLLSGLTLDQKDSVLIVYQGLGFVERKTYIEDDWCCLELFYDSPV